MSGRFLSTWSSHWGSHLSHVQQIQVLMCIVVSLGAAIMGLHTLASKLFRPAISPAQPTLVLEPSESSTEPLVVKETSQEQATKKSKPSLAEIVKFLTRSPHIQCLAVMALSQGLSTNLVEIAWKSHLHMLHPSPAAYAVRYPKFQPQKLHHYDNDLQQKTCILCCHARKWFCDSACI